MLPSERNVMMSSKCPLESRVALIRGYHRGFLCRRSLYNARDLTDRMQPFHYSAALISAFSSTALISALTSSLTSSLTAVLGTCSCSLPFNSSAILDDAVWFFKTAPRQPPLDDLTLKFYSLTRINIERDCPSSNTTVRTYLSVTSNDMLGNMETLRISRRTPSALMTTKTRLTCQTGSLP